MAEPEVGDVRLADLRVGFSGVVVGFCGCNRRAQRLAELGMTTGVKIEVMQAAPGQPMLLRVRRTLLALDRDSASEILVRPLGDLGAAHGRGRGMWRRRRWRIGRRRQMGEGES